MQCSAYGQSRRDFLPRYLRHNSEEPTSAPNELVSNMAPQTCIRKRIDSFTYSRSKVPKPIGQLNIRHIETARFGMSSILNFKLCIFLP